jgi:hypothetical protein
LGGPGGRSQNYISFASTLTLYPYRFTANWLYDGAGTEPRGRVSDNVIKGQSGTDNTNYAFNSDTRCPEGRQFWASDISFQANGSFAGRLYIYGGPTINEIKLLLSKPNGFSNTTNQSYSYNISIELINQGITTAISSSGFNVSNL